MANKTWVGGVANFEGDLSVANNWKPISIRSGDYQWTASGSGTGEYYLEAAGGGDPSLEEPDNVQENGTDLAAGTAGSLTASQWDWADNDTLGFSTVYVRLADDADPDSKAAGYVAYTATPAAGDHVRIPASSTQAINAGLDSMSGFTIGDFIVEEGYSKAIGDSETFLRITCGLFAFAGSGVSYIDLMASAIAPTVSKSATPSTGQQGLYLIGSAMTTLSISGGNVGLAARNGETSTVTTVRVSGAASVAIGEGATVTTIYQTGGTVIANCAATTVTVYGGTFISAGDQAITTLNLNDGDAYAGSTGTITTVNINGGTLDLTITTVSRTITNLKLNPEGSLRWDPNTVTITNWQTPDHPIEYSTENA